MRLDQVRFQIDGTQTSISSQTARNVTKGLNFSSVLKTNTGAEAVQMSKKQNSMQANVDVVARDDKDEKEQFIIRNTAQTSLSGARTLSSEQCVG